MKIAFKTFGCKANSTDSDALTLEAERRGFEVVGEDERADAYVINSCTVTEAADRDARIYATRTKRSHPLSLVAVVGCYAQVAKDELLSLPEVDLVVGTANKFRVLDYLTDANDRGLWNRDQVESARGFLPELFQGSRHSRATIKVQDGCNYSCSFCIIPKARGRSRSLDLGTVLGQVQEAYRQGFEEVVLTGIHLAHYGWDRGTDLLGLLSRILAEPEGPRIRLSTLDPFEIPDALIELLGVEKRLCPHFHIALQSGSDRVLKSMQRIYRAKEFVQVTQKIAGKWADTFVGVDVIVGFPGETREDFEQTIDVLKRSYWTKLHVFPFSVRPGTKAAELRSKVPAAEIRRRVTQLLTLSAARHGEFLESQLGKAHEAVLEKPSAQDTTLWFGHTQNYVPVVVPLANARPRARIPVLMQKLLGERLLAHPLTGAGF